MTDCIIIPKNGKLIRFIHQPVYDGAGDSVHCIFCQKSWATRAEAQREVEEQRKLLRP